MVLERERAVVTLLRYRELCIAQVGRVTYVMLPPSDFQNLSEVDHVKVRDVVTRRSVELMRGRINAVFRGKQPRRWCVVQQSHG